MQQDVQCIFRLHLNKQDIWRWLSNIVPKLAKQWCMCLRQCDRQQSF